MTSPQLPRCLLNLFQVAYLRLIIPSLSPLWSHLPPRVLSDAVRYAMLRTAHAVPSWSRSCGVESSAQPLSTPTASTSHQAVYLQFTMAWCWRPHRCGLMLSTRILRHCSKLLHRVSSLPFAVTTPLRAGRYRGTLTPRLGPGSESVMAASVRL